MNSIDVSNLAELDYLGIGHNFLQTLDVSACNHLQDLSCGNNLLNTLFMKNGYQDVNVYISNNLNLRYICADEIELNHIEAVIVYDGLTNCHVNSYCSFEPGGTFYTISGNNRYDENADGCDASDTGFPYFRLSVTDGTSSGNLIPDANGAYHYDVQAGTQTINPVLENPTYFTISPVSATVTFPENSSPFLQDFCVVANGIHPDLEITILPIGIARPGFDAHYKIIYKNKGTTTQSGSINLSFDDSVLDFVSANPTLSNQTINNLNWNFTNLLPFETREIAVTLNINSPVETPAVNSGDILSYTANIIAGTDETPNDNTSELNQTLRNSVDPNYKTCLEGTTISRSMVGNYVHYMIRFENTGTFAAENIVVKDIIDTTKFEISTLIPESSSHNFVTKINGNKAEFIFENINLPFDDAHNDGYVAFKIKTKPTLVVGNSFSNNANIYFDYNPAFVTNTATTTITALSTQDFNFNTMFTLSPVPAKNELTITNKQDSVISSASIYSTLGQLIQVYTNLNQMIDVSGLTTGTYFIKILSDKGTASSKFIKE